MLQVVHDESGKYANVQTIMSYKGEKLPAVNKDVLFDIDNPNMDIFNSLGDNMKLKITGSPEWKSTHQTAPSIASKEDVVIEDIPEKSLTEDDLGGEPVDLDSIPF
jgi:hypothetical protein